MEQTSQTMEQNKYYTAATALQIRLDTQPIINDIELFLRGARLIIKQDEDGRMYTEKVPIGSPKANDLGIQAILNFVTAFLNPQVVQGNFDKDMWQSYVYEQHVNLTTNIVVNCYYWAIIDEDIDVIVDFIMSMVVPFTSRLIDNKERESYAETIKSFETNNTSQQQNHGFFGR